MLILVEEESRLLLSALISTCSGSVSAAAVINWWYESRPLWSPGSWPGCQLLTGLAKGVIQLRSHWVSTKRDFIGRLKSTRLGAWCSGLRGLRLVWHSEKYWLRMGWESPWQERSYGDLGSLLGWENLWFHLDSETPTHRRKSLEHLGSGGP
jgi:hypothetical protein